MKCNHCKRNVGKKGSRLIRCCGSCIKTLQENYDKKIQFCIDEIELLQDKIEEKRQHYIDEQTYLYEVINPWMNDEVYQHYLTIHRLYRKIDKLCGQIEKLRLDKVILINLLNS